MTTLTESQRAYVKGLRDMADFLEKHPIDEGIMPFDIWVGAESRGITPSQGAKLLGIARKSIDMRGDFGLERKFGPHKIRIYWPRESVCERIVTGTKEVEEEIPDPDYVAPEVPKIKVTRTVDVVEFKCPPSMLAGKAQVIA